MEILLVQNIPKKEISIKRKKKETNCIILRNSIRSMLENIAGRISKHPRPTSAQHRTKNTTLCYYTKSNPSLEPTQVVAWTLSPNHPRSRPTANSPRFSPPHSSEWNRMEYDPLDRFDSRDSHWMIDHMLAGCREPRTGSTTRSLDELMAKRWLFLRRGARSTGRGESRRATETVSPPPSFHPFACSPALSPSSTRDSLLFSPPPPTHSFDAAWN